MNDCPFCGNNNIEGVDVCEECGQPLTHDYLHEPATEVERSLLNDHIGALEPNVPMTVKAPANTTKYPVRFPKTPFNMTKPRMIPPTPNRTSAIVTKTPDKSKAS